MVPAHHLRKKSLIEAQTELPPQVDPHQSDDHADKIDGQPTCEEELKV